MTPLFNHNRGEPRERLWAPAFVLTWLASLIFGYAAISSSSNRWVDSTGRSAPPRHLPLLLGDRQHLDFIKTPCLGAPAQPRSQGLVRGKLGAWASTCPGPPALVACLPTTQEVLRTLCRAWGLWWPLHDLEGPLPHGCTVRQAQAQPSPSTGAKHHCQLLFGCRGAPIPPTQSLAPGNSGGDYTDQEQSINL